MCIAPRPTTSTCAQCKFNSVTFFAVLTHYPLCPPYPLRRSILSRRAWVYAGKSAFMLLAVCLSLCLLTRSSSSRTPAEITYPPWLSPSLRLMPSQRYPAHPALFICRSGTRHSHHTLRAQPNSRLGCRQSEGGAGTSWVRFGVREDVVGEVAGGRMDAASLGGSIRLLPFMHPVPCSHPLFRMVCLQVS